MRPLRPNRFADAAHVDEFMTRPRPPLLETLRAFPGRYAVLGAGGKMDSHLARLLQRGLRRLDRGDSITCVSRFSDAAKRDAFAAAGLPTIAADLSATTELATLPDFDHVFYLAGIKFGAANDGASLERMNVLMPRQVAAIKFSGLAPESALKKCGCRNKL
jgi:hypothetical protein